jgi:steroid delta-isomerase-like uncharacterized protein
VPWSHERKHARDFVDLVRPFADDKQDAERVYGVKSVKNELEVRTLNDDRRADAELGGDVLQALMLNSLVPATVEANVDDGIVTLTWTANWQFQRDEAESAATNILGVIAVQDEIGQPDQQQLALKPLKAKAFRVPWQNTIDERERIALSDNIEIITRFEHAFRAGDLATIDELCDPGVVDHNPAPDQDATLAGFRQKVAGFRSIFPDLEYDLQDIIASGDTVATRWVVTGSLQQEFMGIPATGQTIRVEGMNFYRLEDGRLTDIWTQFDGVGMMQQLGALPA